jgi:hypothetical protein
MSYEGYKQGIHKSKCGLIRSFVKLEGNRIEDIAFSGDFFLFPETAIEQIALEYGVFNIALPTRSFVKSAHAKGYGIEYFGTCCGCSAGCNPHRWGFILKWQYFKALLINIATFYTSNPTQPKRVHKSIIADGSYSKD